QAGTIDLDQRVFTFESDSEVMDHSCEQVFADAALAPYKDGGAAGGDLLRLLQQCRGFGIDRDPYGKRLRFGGFGLHARAKLLLLPRGCKPTRSGLLAGG